MSNATESNIEVAEKLLVSVVNDFSAEINDMVENSKTTGSGTAEGPLIDRRLKIVELYLQLSIAKSLQSLDEKGIYIHKR